MTNRVQRNPFRQQPSSSEGSDSLAKKTQKTAKNALATPQPSHKKREREWTNQTDKPASPNTPKRPNNSEAVPGTPTGSYHSPRSAQSPRTPTAVTVPVMPQLKGKTRSTSNTPENVEQSFGTLLPISEQPSNLMQSLRNKKGIFGNSYQLPSGQVVDTIAQPTKGPTCGPGCVLMIGLKNLEKMVNSQEFWNWYGETGLSKGECLLNAFKHIDIPARVCKMTRQQDAMNHTDLLKDPFDRKILDEKQAVAYVEEKIAETGNPVILAIAHPHIKGHWIIVDGFDKNNAFIRDPYTGKAFALERQTLSKWLLEKDPVQEMVYFP